MAPGNVANRLLGFISTNLKKTKRQSKRLSSRFVVGKDDDFEKENLNLSRSKSLSPKERETKTTKKKRARDDASMVTTPLAAISWPQRPLARRRHLMARLFSYSLASTSTGLARSLPRRVAMDLLDDAARDCVKRSMTSRPCWRPRGRRELAVCDSLALFSGAGVGGALGAR